MPSDVIGEEDDEDDIFETPEYSPKSEFSKPKKVEEAVTNCINARGKEMCKGFWNTKLTKDGSPIRTWVEDSRKVFIGTVIALRNLLAPEISRDKNFKKFEENFNTSKQTLFTNYSYTEKQLERTGEGKKWVSTKRKMIPEIDAIIVHPNPTNQSSAKETRGYWNLYTNAYYDELLLLYDEVFAQVNILIDSLNYFKQVLHYG